MFGSNYLGGAYFAGQQLLLSLGVPTWVSPLNHASPINQTTELVFLIPQGQANLHFEIQLDKVNTFNGANLQSIKSWVSQTGWQYYNGSIWTPIPSTGVDPSYAGSQAKFTIQIALSVGVWYRRIRGRVLI